MEELSDKDKEPASLYESAERLEEEHKNIKELVVATGKFIRDHARSLPERYKPKSIIESRFTPAEEAFQKGMTSCGAMANISAEMLRHLGFKVKLVHGESKESVDHAWISIYNPNTNSWKEYDLTRKNADIPPTHIKKGEVESWEDIRDQIINDHKTISDREKKRGLI